MEKICTRRYGIGSINSSSNSTYVYINLYQYCSGTKMRHTQGVPNGSSSNNTTTTNNNDITSMLK